MDSSANINYSETFPLEHGRYKVLFYRNTSGACCKEEATEVIIHFHNTDGELVDCEYQKIN